ncbi:uncharacterized protein CEXT_783071, partial [Caerostris extrusa]
MQPLQGRLIVSISAVIITVCVCRVMTGYLPIEKCDELLPKYECECRKGYLKDVALICQNVSDFEAFNVILSNGSVFEVNTTFQISLSGNSILPKGFLNGLTVSFLSVDDFQTQVEEGAFDGVLYVKYFYVERSSMKEIPDFRAIRSSLQILAMDNSRLTQLKGDNLKNLTRLWRLSFVNNSIAYVADDVFRGTENVTDFDISHNLLTYLPPSLFRSWKRLEYVRLSYNQLLHVDHLFFGTNPEAYDQFRNLLLKDFCTFDANGRWEQDGCSEMHFHLLEQQQHLRLERSAARHHAETDDTEALVQPHRTDYPNMFGEKLWNILYLHLDHCLIQEFDVQIWNELPSLEVLDLSFNMIDKVTNRNIRKYSGSFSSPWLITFQMEPSQYIISVAYPPGRTQRKKKGKPQTRPQPVHLPGSGAALQPGVDFSIANNLIAHLGPVDLQGEHRVQHLDLQGNVIAQVERLTFAKVREKLLSMDLSRNKIKSLQGCLQNLTNLKVLNLSHNRIEVFSPGEFYNMSTLTELYLEGNRIATLDSEIHAMTKLRILSISNNQIRTISTNQIPPKLAHLYLAEKNLFLRQSFYCDCQMLPFLQFLNSSEELTTDEDLCTPSNDGTAQAFPFSCPAPCRCSCTNDRFMLANCSSSGLTHLPSLFAEEQ